MRNLKPDNDEREHVDDAHCFCEPLVEYRHPDTGVEYEDGPLIVHNAADGREAVEVSLREALAPDKGWTLWKREEWRS